MSQLIGLLVQDALNMHQGLRNHLQAMTPEARAAFIKANPLQIFNELEQMFVHVLEEAERQGLERNEALVNALGDIRAWKGE